MKAFFSISNDLDIGKIQLNKDLYNPVYSSPDGLLLHSYNALKPYWSQTNRMHGTTSKGLRIEGLTKAKRDILYAFWYTNLEEGKNSFTYIDHNGRILFECSWNDWIENYSSERGGLFSVEINLKSPVPATPQLFAAYITQAYDITNMFYDYTLNDNDVAPVDAAIVSDDPGAIRLFGPVLKLNKTGTSIYGINSAVNYKRKNSDNSISLFCQFKIDVPDVETQEDTSGTILGVFANDSAVDRFSLHFELKTDVFGALNVEIFGAWINNLTTNIVRLSTAVNQKLLPNTWYDLALTYNAINGTANILMQESVVFDGFVPADQFNNFMVGSDVITDFINNFIELETPAPPLVDWTNFIALYVADSPGTETYYQQNIMIFDGFLTPFDFNTLRRLCKMWNDKTVESPV